MISIGQYQLIQEIIESQEHEVTKAVKTIAIINNFDYDQVRAMPVEKFRALKKEADTELQVIEQTEVQKYFEIDGIGYEIMTEFKYAVTEQFIDMSTLAKDINKNLHLIMSVMAWQRGEPYKSSTNRADLFKDKMDFRLALGAANFFLQTWIELLKGIEIYLTEPAAVGSSESMGTLPLSMRSQTATKQKSRSTKRWAQ